MINNVIATNYLNSFKGEKRFKPSINNFHNLEGIKITSSKHIEVLEWRKSERYKKLCERLYAEGLKGLKKLTKEYFAPKMTEKEIKHHIYVRHTYMNMSDEDYEYNMEHWNEYGEWLYENFKRDKEIGKTHSLQLRYGIYSHIFGHGFDNFINITKQHGHYYNELEIISHMGSWKPDDPDAIFSIIE